MGMNAFELFGVLKLDSSAFESGLNKAGRLASSAGSLIGSGLMSVARVGAQALTVAAGAVTAFGGTAVATGMQFDQMMGTVAATLGTTTDEMQENIGEVDTAYGHFSGTLRDFAQFMGQNTTFTATQAAQALNYMALAGYNTQESMEMLPSVLSMAAAGSMDLALASDMITDSQMALGISFDRTDQMVDEFAKAASSGNTSVQQLGEAFLRVGALARETNGGFVTLGDGTQVAVDNIQELEIAFTAMANRGIKGAEAGTHMRNMLLKLSNPTKDGAGQLEKLGVSVFDAEGNMRGLSEIFGDLSTALESVTQEERLQAVADLFNTRDMASAEGLLAAINQDWNEIGAAILQADGASDQMSKTKLDNLAGDLTLFRSALEGAQIILNDKLSPTLRDFVQMGTRGLQEVASAFKEGDLESAMEAFGTWLADALNMLVAKVPDIVAAGSKMLSALGKGLFDNLDIIIDAGISIVKELGRAIIQALPALIDAALQILETLLSTIDENFDTIADAIGRLIDGIGSALSEHGPVLFEMVTSILGKIVDLIIQNLPQFLQTAAVIMQQMAEGISQNLPIILPAIITMLTSMINIIIENLPMFIDAAVQLLTALATGLIENVALLIPAIIDLVMNIVQALIDNLPLLLEGAIQIVMALAKGILENIPVLLEALPTLVEAIVQGIIDNLPLLLEAAIQLIGMLITGIIENLPLLIASAVDIVAALVKGILQALPLLWSAIGQLLTQIGTAILNGLPKLFANGVEILKSVVGGMLSAMGEVGKGVLQIIANIVSGIAGAASQLLDAGRGIIQKIKDGIFGKINEAKTWGKDMIDNFVGGIKEKVNAVKDAVSNVGQKIKGFLGFSEPEEGPLSNFHTYAPDMMKLFAQGIRDNEKMLTDTVSDAFDFESNIRSASDMVGSVGYGGGYGVFGDGTDRIISLLEQLVNKDPVTIEGDADQMFKVTRKKAHEFRLTTGTSAFA